VLIVAVCAPFRSLKHHRDTERDQSRARVYHEIDATYHSGRRGGGHQTNYRIPRDPKNYAETLYTQRTNRNDRCKDANSGKTITSPYRCVFMKGNKTMPQFRFLFPCGRVLMKTIIERRLLPT